MPGKKSFATEKRDADLQQATRQNEQKVSEDLKMSSNVTTEGFVNGVLQTLPDLTDQDREDVGAEIVGILKKNLYKTVGALKNGMKTVQKWENFCENKIADAFMEAAKPCLELTDTAPVNEWKNQTKIKKFEYTRPFLQREDSIQAFKNYMHAFFSPDEKDRKICLTEDGSKSRLLTTVGIPGTGKTLFVKNMAADVTKDGFLAIFVTYNEGSQPIDLTSDPDMHTNRFVAQLLASNGMKAEDAKVNPPPLGTVIEHLFENNQNCKGIIIFIDELVQIAQDEESRIRVRSLNSKLMGLQDASKEYYGKRVMFVFTALTDVFSDGLMPTGSGRPISKIPLRNLDRENAIAAIPQGHMNIITKSKILYQIFLSCAGHPRLLATLRNKEESYLQKVTDDAEGIKLQKCLIDELCETAKFQNVNITLERAAFSWFTFEMQAGEISELEQRGFIQRMVPTKNELQFMIPLLFHQWEPSTDRARLLKNHLLKLYNADAVLHGNHEKDMETVMTHYECVRKVALGSGSRILLSAFFRDALIDQDIDTEVTIAFPESQKDTLVKEVKKLSGDAVLRFLEQGYTVVSNSHSEQGVERLVPFFKSGNLYVALMQDKFVKKKFAIGDAKEKLDTSDAVAFLNGKSIPYFYCFNTTVDQKSVANETLEDCVFFTEERLFKYTAKLGPLRLHCEKTGAHLKGEQSFLGKGSPKSEEEEEDDDDDDDSDSSRKRKQSPTSKKSRSRSDSSSSSDTSSSTKKSTKKSVKTNRSAGLTKKPAKTTAKKGAKSVKKPTKISLQPSTSDSSE